MKNLLLTFVIVVIASTAASAQKIAKPTLTPKPLTESQQQLVREGVALHDQKRHDEAIAKYQLVLKENPDATLAMYELALSQYAKGDKEDAMETAHRGAKYRSSELPLFYMTMANVIDDVGKPKEAIKIYRDAIKMLEGDEEMSKHLASVHFNLGVTYTRQKLYKEARTELKRAVEINNLYASPHLVLSEIYLGTKYKIPAFLAAARLISLEYNTQRTNRAAEIVHKTFAVNKDEKAGDINIFVDLNAPTDEGDFGMYDLFLGTLTSVKDDEDKGKSDEEMFADAIDTVTSLLDEDEDLTKTFVGKNYVPFMVEMKKLGYSKAFAYLVLYRTGNQNALKWLTENSGKLEGFIKWAGDYRPAK